MIPTRETTKKPGADYGGVDYQPPLQPLNGQPYATQASTKVFI